MTWSLQAKRDGRTPRTYALTAHVSNAEPLEVDSEVHQPPAHAPCDLDVDVPDHYKYLDAYDDDEARFGYVTMDAHVQGVDAGDTFEGTPIPPLAAPASALSPYPRLSRRSCPFRAPAPVPVPPFPFVTQTDGSALAFPCSPLSYSPGTGSREWILDTGASHHLTNSAAGGAYTSRDVRRIHGGGSTMLSNGMSTICGLRNVLVVPTLRPEGLASVAQMLDCAPAGSGVLFTRNGAYFGTFSPRGSTAMAVRKNGLYVTDPSTIAAHQGPASVSVQCHYSDTTHRNRCLVWHGRLGHLSFALLKRLRDKKTHSCIRFSDAEYELAVAEPCPGCAAGRPRKHPMYTKSRGGTPPPSRILEHVQIDIVDNHAVPDRLGYKYALVLVDKYSRRFFVLGLKRKSDSLSALQRWRDRVSSDARTHADPQRHPSHNDP